MNERTLEEEFEYIKELEKQGINPYEPKDMNVCIDCSKCISVCDKRKNEKLTVDSKMCEFE